MMPPGGSGVSRVTPASLSAAELAQLLWPLMSVKITGLFGATLSSIDLCGGVSPKESAW
jgi:hypothetical protein